MQFRLGAPQHGGVAHLVERLAGSQEVVSSILIASTKHMNWPIDKEPKVFATDLTVRQRHRGDQYWVRITTKEWSIITQWKGTQKQIDKNIESWYKRGALAVEVQLILQ